MLNLVPFAGAGREVVDADRDAEFVGQRLQFALPQPQSRNWAKPLVSYRVIVDLISATITDTGLTVRRELDTKTYPKGVTVSDDEIERITIERDEFHGDWNHTILPTQRLNRSS